MYAIFVCMVLAGLILWQVLHLFRLIILKKRCTVACPALCVSSEAKRWGRTVLYNATYSYEYMGITMEGNNGLWCDSGLSGTMEQGSGTMIHIDPDDPREGIFDPLAQAEIKYRIFMSIFVTAIAVSIIIMIFHPEPLQIS